MAKLSKVENKQAVARFFALLSAHQQMRIGSQIIKHYILAAADAISQYV
jgi:hypothetical protein